MTRAGRPPARARVAFGWIFAGHQLATELVISEQTPIA